MSHVIPSPPAINAAPVLAYRTSTAPPVGLHVEQRPGERVLELFPPTTATEMGKAVGWATVVAVALALTPIAVIRARALPFDPQLEPAVCGLIFLAAWPVMFAIRLAAGLALRVSVRIEVTAEHVSWTVSGFRLRYETVRPRGDVAGVELRLHGVRLKRRDGGGDWIAFGTRDQQRQICRLLGEALGVPVRGVATPDAAATVDAR